MWVYKIFCNHSVHGNTRLFVRSGNTFFLHNVVDDIVNLQENMYIVIVHTDHSRAVKSCLRKSQVSFKTFCSLEIVCVCT